MAIHPSIDQSDPQVRAALELAEFMSINTRNVHSVEETDRLVAAYIGARDGRPKEPCNVSIFVDGVRKHCQLEKHDHLDADGKRVKHKID